MLTGNTVNTAFDLDAIFDGARLRVVAAIDLALSLTLQWIASNNNPFKLKIMLSLFTTHCITVIETEVFSVLFIQWAARTHLEPVLGP